MRLSEASLALVALIVQTPSAADSSALQQIRREGLERSQVVRAFDQFVTVVGPRLTGSPAHKAAASLR